MKKYKKFLVMGLVVSLIFVLSACGTSPITDHSTGIWDGLIVLNFSRAIIWLANLFGGSYGLGIIVFTIIVRIIMLPLMVFQTRSMRRTQEIQPQIKALQQKYSSKDQETVAKLREEQQKLYSEAGINPIAGCLPILLQLPIIWALYQAILRTDVLRSGSFLWLQLGGKDPYFIMPILAAIFTFITSWLTFKSQPESNNMAMMMMVVTPVIIFVTALSVPAAVSLYWVVTNAFQAVQTLFLQNPWKIQRERDEKEREQREHDRAINRAKKRATKSRRK